MTNRFAQSSSVIELAPQILVLRQGDRLPGVILDLVDEFDQPIDLTGMYVKMEVTRMSGEAGGPAGIADGPKDLSIRDAVNGLVYYDIQEDDTIVHAGLFELVIRVYSITQDLLQYTVPTEEQAFLEIVNHPDASPEWFEVDDDVGAPVTEFRSELENAIVLTAAEYDALVAPDQNAIYYITKES